MNAPAEMSTAIVLRLSEMSTHVHPETWKRATAMIQALLQEAEASPGEYVFVAKALFREYESLPSPHLEITPGSQPNLLIIKMKARGGNEGTLWGDLQLPHGVKRERLLQEAGLATRKFNAEGWSDVVNFIPPGPPPERVMTRQVFSDVARAHDADGAARPGNGAASGGLVSHASSGPPPDQSEKERCARFLLRLLRGAENGLFLIKNASPAAREIFPDRNLHGLVTGLFSKLTGFGWIRRVGKGQFQVEEVFVRERNLGFNLKPLPKLARNSSSSRLVPRKANPTTAPDLAGQLEALKDNLLAEKARLEGIIASARRDLATVEATMSQFQQGVQSALGPLVDGFLPKAG